MGTTRPSVSSEPGFPLDPGPEKRRFYLALARAAIGGRLQGAAFAPPRPEAGEPRIGAFVTLSKGGRLRGCIGRMESAEPLSLTIQAMALAAAFEDPRFEPLRPEEFEGLDLEITLLGPRRPIASAEEILVGRHGVHLQRGYASAVFLPQVATEQGWDRETLLEELGMKAGLGPEAWKAPGTRLSVFEGLVFGES